MAASVKISQLIEAPAVGPNDTLPIARGGLETFKTPARQFVTQAVNIGLGPGQLFSLKTESTPTTLQFRTLSAKGENLAIATIGDTVVFEMSGQNPYKRSFIGDGIQTSWPLAPFNSVNAANYRVDIDGVLQEPFVNYSLSANQIIFASAPPLSGKIVIVSSNIVRLTEAVVAPNSVEPQMLTVGGPVWDTGGNLTVTNSITAGSNVQIYKSSIGAWISIGDKKLTHDTWILDDMGGHIMPLRRTRLFFYGTGSNQTFVVPATSNYIYVKLWGGGGGGGRIGGWSQGSHGGGAGHTRGLIPVTPGETLTIITGKGGPRTPGASSTYGFGGGNLNNADISYGGAGGGGSFIFRNYVNTTPMPGGIPLLIAGGGGGGGSSRAYDAGAAGWGYNDGGAGGGLIGSRGVSMFDSEYLAGGQGGTQTAPGNGGNNYTAGGASSAGLAGGGSYSGGVYSANNSNQYQGGTAGTNSYGGGGGGGWYGGGGGAYSEANTMAGGGGGSGYVHSSVIFGETFTGMGRGPSYSGDTDLVQGTENKIEDCRGQHYGLGFGGGWQSNGFDGLVVIYH